MTADTRQGQGMAREDAAGRGAVPADGDGGGGSRDVAGTAAPATPATDGPGPDEAAVAGTVERGDPVKRWTLLVLLVVIVLVGWYLRADRITPATSQARVHALVVPIAPEVQGTITGVFVRNNQRVEAGQRLFQIDIERYELAVETARASLDLARQAREGAAANVDAARANLDSALANEERARLDAVRIRTIREQDPGAMSQRRLESAEASLASAQGRVASARAGLQGALENLGAPGDLNAQVRQAKASLDTALLNLARATVRAPEDGVVTGMRIDKGNFAGAGAPQMTFIGLENIWVQADFKENNLGHLDPDDTVDIVFDAYPGRVFRGAVREIGFGVTVNDPPLGSLPTIQNDRNWLRQAQRYPVLIDFAVPDGPVRLKVGSQATVVVYTGEHPLFNALARWLMRLQALLTFAY
jgi:multidrug resistance efflux pump